MKNKFPSTLIVDAGFHMGIPISAAGVTALAGAFPNEVPWDNEVGYDFAIAMVIGYDVSQKLKRK